MHQTFLLVLTYEFCHIIMNVSNFSLKTQINESENALSENMLRSPAFERLMSVHKSVTILKSRTLEYRINVQQILFKFWVLAHLHAYSVLNNSAEKNMVQNLFFTTYLLPTSTLE